MTTTTHMTSGLSALFSLSHLAASASPIPVPDAASSDQGKDHLSKDAKDAPAGKNGSHTHAQKHRRLSSTGQMRRRLSDAKDAASRTSPASLHAASALNSLASLSLSSAAVAPMNVRSSFNGHHTRSRSQSQFLEQGDILQNSSVHGSYEVNPVFKGFSDSATAGTIPIPIATRSSRSHGAVASSVPTLSLTSDTILSNGDYGDVDIEDDGDDGASVVESVSGSAKNATKGVKEGRKGKKRGTILKCESCSKVYRHPSCLGKHRWEHSPHWNEASKFLLSKHQQVQLLEAAAILSHLDPGSSLPDDRTLWPSYLSNGTLSPPSSVNGDASLARPSPFTKGNLQSGFKSTSVDAKSFHPTAPHSTVSSAPTRAQAARIGKGRSGSVSTSFSVSTSVGTSAGPRLHDFAVQGGVMQIRPGLLAQPAAPAVSGALGHRVAPYADDKGVRDNDVSSVTRFTSPSKPQPMAVPIGNTLSKNGGLLGYDRYRDDPKSGVSIDSDSVSASLALSGGGWSLPRSDIRSGSVTLDSHYSASRSGSRSDDDEDGTRSVPDGSEEEIDVDVDDGEGSAGSVASRFGRSTYRTGHATEYGSYTNYGFPNRELKDNGRDKRNNDEQDGEWVGMDMDMDP